MKLVNEIILYYDARSNEHQMNLINLRKKLVKCYTWSIAQYGAETWTLWKVDQKYLESFEMWYCRRMEISWTDHVKMKRYCTNKEEWNILNIIRRKAKGIGHILCRNCLPKHVTEGRQK